MKSILLVGAALLVSCQPQDLMPVQGLEKSLVTEEATFTATLAPITGTVSGTAEVSTMDGMFSGKVSVTNGVSGTTYAQNIYTATSCPTGTTTAMGEAYIPLDGDLSSIERGSEAFPSADESGSYVYDETTPLQTLLIELETQTLELEGKIVVIEADGAPVACGALTREGGTPGPTPMPMPGQTPEQQQQQQQQQQQHQQTQMSEQI